MIAAGHRTNGYYWEKIGSSPNELESICAEIRAVLEVHGLSKLRFQTELLARESLSNAVNHGNGGDADKLVVVRLWLGRQWIRLQVEDEGAGFAWRRAHEKEFSETKCSGRGLQIYTVYAGRVRFNRCGNQVTLWIRKNNET